VLRYLLDTNFCIRVLRGRLPQLRSRFNAEGEALSISTVVLTELLAGAWKSDKPIESRREVERFVDRLTVLPFDASAAAHAAEIKAMLERQGQTIGAYDALIAGHARSLGLIVVTANLREFRRVDSLRYEDWLSPAP